MRVVTHMSSAYEGISPILRRNGLRATNAAMADERKIDVAALKRAVIEATGTGKAFSRRSLSLAATNGKNPDLIRDLISRGQDKNVSFDVALGIAEALRVDISNFVLGYSLRTHQYSIPVIGTVEAGVWREQEAWEKEQQYEVEVMPIAYERAERFGLEVTGYSMDKMFLPGTILDCIRVPNPDGLVPIPGDIVIVVRQNGNLFETTCKRLEQLPDGSFQLRAESTRAEFAEPISLGKPDDAHFADSEVRIIAIVNSSITRVMRR